MARFVGPVGAADIVVLVEVVGTVEVVETVGTVETVDIVDTVEMLDVVDTVDFVLLVEADVVDGAAEEVDEIAGCAFPCNMNVMYPPSSLQIVTYDAWIPVDEGENTNGTASEAPAAKVEPKAGKADEV